MLHPHVANSALRPHVWFIASYTEHIIKKKLTQHTVKGPESAGLIYLTIYAIYIFIYQPMDRIGEIL